MKCLLILWFSVYGCLGNPLVEGNSSESNKIFEKDLFDTVEVGGENIPVTQGFFAIKQQDGRWLIEVYSADSVRGTRILYCGLIFYVFSSFQ